MLLYWIGCKPIINAAVQQFITATLDDLNIRNVNRPTGSTLLAG